MGRTQSHNIWPVLVISASCFCVASRLLYSYGPESERGKTSRREEGKGPSLLSQVWSLFKWNFEGSCDRIDCHYLHSCYHCGEYHRAPDCPPSALKGRRELVTRLQSQNAHCIEFNHLIIMNSLLLIISNSLGLGLSGLQLTTSTQAHPCPHIGRLRVLTLHSWVRPLISSSFSTNRWQVAVAHPRSGGSWQVLLHVTLGGPGVLQTSALGVPLCQEGQIVTPLRFDQWNQELVSHPDRTFSNYILRGIKEGFHIGFNRASPLSPTARNIPSPKPEIISEYLGREVSLGRMDHVPPGQQVHLSPLGIIPKKNKPGKWRLIMDLSSPEGESMNDGIDKNLLSLHYTSVDHCRL